MGRRWQGVAVALFVLVLVSAPSAAAQGTTGISVVTCSGDDLNCQETPPVLGGPVQGVVWVPVYNAEYQLEAAACQSPTTTPAPDASTRVELCDPSNMGVSGPLASYSEPVVVVAEGHEVAARHSYVIRPGGLCPHNQVAVRIDAQIVGLRNIQEC